MLRRIFVSVCILMLSGFAALGQSISEEDETYLRANTVFFIYHELGHALIDKLRLPVFGQEEDAADVLGVVLSETINSEEDNSLIMLAAAENFAVMAEAAEQEGYELAFWDLHGLDLQRYYTILCLHYGADPDARQDIANEGGLPEARQESCPGEFTLADESWGPVLQEITRTTDGPDWMRFEGAEPENEAEEILLDAVMIEVDILNDELAPDTAITMTFARCGEANAYYIPDESRIVICAELAGLFLTGGE